MIKSIKGNLLNSDAEALVNAVNCVGIMGKGIALQFKKAFPENFLHYKAACDRKELQPGKLFIYETNMFYNPKYIVNFPTKNHWKEKSQITFIETGLSALIEEIRKRSISSIAIPPLGCGLGGLQWEEVRSKIKDVFEQAPDVRVLLYEPVETPEAG